MEAAVAVDAALVRTPVDDAVYVVILHGFVQDQLAALFGVEALDAKDIVHHHGETILSDRRSQTNSHISMLTDMLLDETPEILSDNKNFLFVYPTGVFLLKKKNGIYVSVYLRNRDTKFVGVSSGVLSLVYREKVDYAKLCTKAVQTAVSTERLAHFFDEIHMQLHFPLDKKLHLLFQIHDINIDDGAEARSYFGFFRLYDDDVVEDSE